MNDLLLRQIATTFGLLSLVAIGGANAVIPEMRREVVDVLGWMDTPTFVNLFAVAQAAPGPNVLIVSLIGWHVAGWAGLLVATLAILIPSSLLALAAGRLLDRLAETRSIRLAKAGLIPIAIGLILASGVVMARSTDEGVLGVAITAGAAVFMLKSRLNPLLALGLGMLVSIMAAPFGIAP